MPSGFNWWRAAKNDYVRGHGSVPHWAGDYGPRQESVENIFARKARAQGAHLIREFRKRNAADRIRLAPAYREAVLKICAVQRNAIRPKNKKLIASVQLVQNQHMAALKRSLDKAKSTQAKKA